MQIHDLNEKTLTNPAYVAFDDGTDTYKADFKAEIDNAAASAVADADLTDNTVAFTSGDAESPTTWTAVSVLTSGLTIKELFNRISTMIKNVRYIWNLLGSSSFSNVASTLTGAIGNTALTTTAQTLSGAIAEHERDISGLNSKSYIVTQWVSFSYYTSEQLVGTYVNPTVPTGFGYRLIGIRNVFANNATGVKFSGAYLEASGNTIRAKGNGFVSGETATLLVIFEIYKQ